MNSAQAARWSNLLEHTPTRLLRDADGKKITASTVAAATQVHDDVSQCLERGELLRFLITQFCDGDWMYSQADTEAELCRELEDRVWEDNWKVDQVWDLDTGEHVDYEIQTLVTVAVRQDPNDA